MFWLAPRASRRLLKPSVSLFAVSSCHLTTATANPYPNFYQNAGLLGPFNQRHRCTPSCVEFDLRLLAHLSSSSSSTGEKNDGNQGCDGAKVDASWIDLYFPRQAGPYAKLARLDRPGCSLGLACMCVDPTVVLPLYFSGVCWTLVSATIYDKEDDLKVDVKSTALRFADSTEEWITGFGIMCMSSLALGGYTAEIGGPYYAFLSAASGQLAWQIWTADLSSRADCNRKFVSNKWFGAIIFSGIQFGRLSSQG
ncbi:hypothetical protein EV2_020986 [Malus domestica]